MSANAAAVSCPRCPSDSADWAMMTGMGAGSKPMVVGTMFRCMVCSLRWVSTSMGGDYIPEDDYWTGDEFDG